MVEHYLDTVGVAGSIPASRTILLDQLMDALCPTHFLNLAGMNSARYFIRREEDAPKSTPRDSPFRKFDVKCLKCGSYKLSVTAEFDDDLGELRVILNCPRCRAFEVLTVK